MYVYKAHCPDSGKVEALTRRRTVIVRLKPLAKRTVHAYPVQFIYILWIKNFL